jgi:hypothetical protein
VAADERTARARAEFIAGYVRTSAIVAPQFRNPPGYLSIEDNARILGGEKRQRSGTKDSRFIDMHSASVQVLIDAAIMFCGTPDHVYAQIVEFCEYCGGMGNLIMTGHAGSPSHEDTVDNLMPFAKEGLPRLKEYKRPRAEAPAAA